MNLEMKQVNVSKFMAEVLEVQLGTFSEMDDLMEGVVEPELLSFDMLKNHIRAQFGQLIDPEIEETIEREIEDLQKAAEGEKEIFAYWES